MFGSWNDALIALRAWRRERFGHGLFVPAAMTLLCASLVGDPWPCPGAFAISAAMAWLALLALRLWDDLEDRPRDATQHPERVLPQVTQIRPFVLLVIILVMVIGVMTRFSGGSLAVWVGLIGLLMVFYRVGGQTRAGGDLVVLLKYPAMVFVLRGSLDLVGFCVMALVFTAVCFDELVQGSDTPKSRLAMGGGLVVGSAGLLLWQFREPTSPLVAVQGVLVVAMATLVVQAVFGAPRRRVTRGGLLALTMIILLIFNFAGHENVFHASS